uniref:Uncharacterized protein n=1 Tax=Salmo trutta TaxID=8032 RepID=A0A674AM04_SALTR
MKTVHRDGYYAGSIELSDMINRRCVKCFRADLVQSRTMRIRTGIIFWNLIFSMMFSCVKGTSLQYFFLFCFIFGGGGVREKIDCSFFRCHSLRCIAVAGYRLTCCIWSQEKEPILTRLSRHLLFG